MPNEEPKIIGKEMKVVPQYIGRDKDNNVVIQIAVIDTVVLKNISDMDVIEWHADGIALMVNGQVVGDMFSNNNPIKTSSNAWKEKFKKDMYVDKEGKLRYKEDDKSVLGEQGET